MAKVLRIASLIALCRAPVAEAQTYPTRPMRPDLAARFAEQGADIIASSPAEFGAHIKTELARWAKVVKEAGIKAD